MKIPKPRYKRGGFALVVTLSLMILLTIFAVGLLSLSSIALRSSSQGQAMAEARANARMAMMLAIADLQKYSGKDTRITARADILGENKPPVLGVWKSWEGTNHQGSSDAAPGQPKAPDYSNNKQTRFLAWLASTPGTPADSLASLPNTVAGNNKVMLLGANSVGATAPDKRQVYLAPTLVNISNQQGAYAWWVSGENQKARLPKPYAPAADNPAGWSELVKNHSQVDTEPFGLDVLHTDDSVEDPLISSPASKAPTLKQVDLIGAVTNPVNKKSQEHYHDLSASSVGLLTNSATGGWRKDLSLAAENWTSLPTSGLPLFRATPESDIVYNRAAPGSPYAARSILYPWATYRGNSSTVSNTAIYRFPAIGTWTNLVNYATLYKKAAATSGPMAFDMKGESINGDTYKFTHEPRIMPVIARMQWVFSHRVRASQTPNRYDLEAVINPAVTLWNPYNVTLKIPIDLSFSLNGSLPPVIDYKINGLSRPKKFTLQGARITGATAAEAVGIYPGGASYFLKGPLTLKPGETRVFGADGASNNLKEGFRPLEGIGYSIAKAVGDSTQSGDASGVITTSMTFDSEFEDIGKGVGMYLDMGGGRLAYRMIYDKAAANTYYPPRGVDKFLPLSFAKGANVLTPFLSVTFGARMASNTHLSSKGFVQSSPFVNYTAMGRKSKAEFTINYAYPGVLHNVNSTFEYSFQSLKEGSAFLPGTGTKGYIVTGFQISDGLSRCVIAELPGRPLSSLGELQNWDARYENPVPPYSFNIVGNSDATPLIGKDVVVNAAEASAKKGENLQNDDSYCLNHLLFDDWFFSTIAPHPAAFGAPPASSTIKSTYIDFLTDPTRPLQNRAYKPVAEDVLDPDAAFTKNVSAAGTSWKTIASRLQVEGMFNVNSTSVTAWRALLGHARNQKVPHMDGNGAPTLSGDTNYAVSRFSVAGDVESKQSGTSGAQPECAEYAGYRVFNDEQLDFLADEIVKQVRLRGPFLSLSEFVNRQLSSTDGLSLAGAIQTALNNLSAGSNDPFKKLKVNLTPETSNVAIQNPPGPATGYAFPKAAEGYNIYGIPGWTRQADVLRPIAPILTVRDDTFTLRCYGDSREPGVNGRIIATAVCEATVRRSRNYVDPTDDSALADLSTGTGSVPAKKPINEKFGRRYEIISFRWLAAGEI